MTETKRLEWVDQLKGIVMVFVVLGHMTYDKQLPYVVFCYAFHMPLFFMVSGLTARIHRNKHSLDQERFRNFAWLRFKQLLIPYLLLNIVFIPVYWLNHHVLSGGSFSFKELIIGVLYSNQDRFIVPTAATWFLPTLFLSLMLFFLIEKFAKGDCKTILIMGIFCGTISFFDSLTGQMSKPWDLNAVPLAACMICIGYVLLDNIDKITEGIRNFCPNIVLRWFLAIGCIIVGGAIALINGKCSMPGNIYHSFVYFILAMVLISAGIIFIAVKMKPLWIFKFIGQNTIFYMAAQCPLKDLIANIMGPGVVENHPILLGIAVILILIPCSMIINIALPFLVGKKYKFRSKKV
ncbi:MAG: acyltransferase family protein [Eubacteriaceae bacterium]|nr:acyltransferase family protein [Eubacteriaceae bacterium]